MTACMVLAHASALGIVLTANGEKICYKAPHGLPADLRAELTTHKAELLALLDATSVGELAPSPRSIVAGWGEPWPESFHLCAAWMSERGVADPESGALARLKIDHDRPERVARPVVARTPVQSPCRSVVASGSVARREAWGTLANRLAAEGFAWPADEAEAFRRLNAAEDQSEVKPRSRQPHLGLVATV